MTITSTPSPAMAAALAATITWLRSPSGRPRPYLLLRCPVEDQKDFVRNLQREIPNLAITAPGGTAAQAATEAINLPVRALPRLLYRKEEGERRLNPEDHVGPSTPTILLSASRLPRDLAGDLLATGSPVIMLLHGDPDPGSFAAGRAVDLSTRQAQGARILRPLSPGYVLRLAADGTPEILATHPAASDLVSPGTVFRAQPSPAR